MLVDLSYDLADVDGDLSTISIKVSTDGGATWDAPAVTFAGDLGPAIAPGVGHAIVWDSGADLPGLAGMLMARVVSGAFESPAQEMVPIPGGEFEMGDHHGVGGSTESPVHTVLVDSFHMGIYTVTNRQYADALNWAYAQELIYVSVGWVYATTGTPIFNTYPRDSGSHVVWDGSLFTAMAGKEDHPVVKVNWLGAAAYANWKSTQDGLTPSYQPPNNPVTWACNFDANGYRLPTEAEWEYAARGGEHEPYYLYPWGDTIDGSMANYLDSGDPFETGPNPRTVPVGYYDGGQTPPGSDMRNGYGLHQMVGNVWQFCNDWFDGLYYLSSPYDNPHGGAPGNSRVARGGAWNRNAINYLRCARRGGELLTDRSWSTGFRLVLNSEGGSAINSSWSDSPLFEVDNQGTIIPTVSGWGVVVLALLMLTVGTVVCMRRYPACA
jgi:formylglycine-generating enzyme required for sulfatase activity